MDENVKRIRRISDAWVTKKCCSDCPFRRESSPGWLGPNLLADIIEKYETDEEFICHKTLGESDKICRGYVHLRNNACKDAHTSNRLFKVQNDLAGEENGCFETIEEFIEHHDYNFEFRKSRDRDGSRSS